MTRQASQMVHREEAIIQTYLAPLAAGHTGAFGLRDDCAVITPPPGYDLVVKTDPVRAGVHFFADDAPRNIAWKALAVNISDLVAKGATPHAYVMALSFPAAPSAPWMRAFADGLAAAQAAFGCALIGGDTDRAEGALSIAVTAFGLVPTGRMVRRGAAVAGDVLYVSGDLGASALGLKLRRQDVETTSWRIDGAARQALIGRYLEPAPRVALADALRAHARAAMDLSDGLHKDVDRMCRASGVGCRIELARLPLATAVRAIISDHPALARLAWSGGDDYEVLCAVPPVDSAAFEAAADAVGVAVTRIGVIAAGTAVSLIDATGAVLADPATGFDHF